ncbi:hypothetical protein SAMN05444166_0973 [Singulisphaera sp. GP187]|uniref:hypothetical protein n=1 Tax=Singulisphaera sp. GP187 TaxID=1882752 RepID=UPI0009272F57|nr:hypothetical protein [Singulisphaera sp. GP187]SIN80541.1 hypothetical protein SAMN05444166_0973 [Singulisphaera sp. GP187]
MTFDECHSTLPVIRQKQGTRNPLVRVDYAGQVIRGRVARADSDPEHGSEHEQSSPYGVIVLENLGLCQAPETILQIANIPAGALKELNAP